MVFFCQGFGARTKLKALFSRAIVLLLNDPNYIVKVIKRSVLMSWTYDGAKVKARKEQGFRGRCKAELS